FDGRLLAARDPLYTDATINLWDIEKRREICKLDGHEDYITQMDFARDGLRLASGSFDGTARAWDVGACRPASIPLRGHETTVRSVAFSPDGRRLATGGADRAIILWDLAAGRPLFKVG